MLVDIKKIDKIEVVNVEWYGIEKVILIDDVVRIRTDNVGWQYFRDCCCELLDESEYGELECQIENLTIHNEKLEHEIEGLKKLLNGEKGDNEDE